MTAQMVPTSPVLEGAPADLPQEVAEWLEDDACELEQAELLERGGDPDQAEIVEEILDHAAQDLQPGERLDVRLGRGLFVVKD